MMQPIILNYTNDNDIILVQAQREYSFLRLVDENKVVVKYVLRKLILDTELSFVDI